MNKLSLKDYYYQLPMSFEYNSKNPVFNKKLDEFFKLKEILWKMYYNVK